jgi:hypothetical protein
VKNSGKEMANWKGKRYMYADVQKEKNKDKKGEI